MFNLPRLGKRIEEILGGFGNQINRTIGGLGQQANNVGNQVNQGVKQIQRTANDVGRQNVNVINRQVQQVQRQIPKPPQVDFNKLSRNLANAANPLNQFRQQADAVNRNVIKPLNDLGQSQVAKQYGVSPQQLQELQNKPLSERVKFAVNRPVELTKENPMMSIMQSPLNPTQSTFQSFKQSPVNLPKPDLTGEVDALAKAWDENPGKNSVAGKVIGFAGENIVYPIAKNFARYGDVTTGQQEYSKGVKGLTEGATDAFGIASTVYAPLGAGKLAQGGKVALKAIPGTLARGAGAGAGTSALNQYAETGKVDPMTTVLSAGIGAGANLLPGVGGVLARGAKGGAKYLNSPEALTQGGFAKLPGKPKATAKTPELIEGVNAKRVGSGADSELIPTNPTVDVQVKPKVALASEDKAKALAFEAYQKTGSRKEFERVYNQAKNGTLDTTVNKPTLKGLGKDDVVPSKVTNMGTILGDFQRYVVDKDAPLLHLAKQFEELDPVKNKGLVDEIYYATGLQRRSNSIANQRINESDSLSGAFRGLSKEQAAQFDDYVAAHRGLQDAKEGKPTNLTEGELQARVTELSPIYQERFSQLNNYYKEWANHLHEGGIISDAKLKTYLANNDYTRIQRDMEDLVNFNTPGKAMSAKVNGVTNQRRKGSTRDILPAAETAVGYAQHAQAEIQRNKSASTLIDMLAPNGMAKRVSAKDAVHRNTINVKRNGKVEIWEVPKDIKELADQVSPYTLGTLGKIIAFPQRLLRAGATGLSAPFTAANYIKDQGSSAIFSKDARATSFNLKNIADGLFQASKDFGYKTNDPAWNKFMLHMGDDTQYHGIRNTANIKDISRELRTGQKGKYVNMAKHSIRTLEDLNSVTEKATRFQHFKGIYDKAIKNGASEADATKAATLAAWQNSTDFSRMGDASRAVNLLVPYFNAGIQGTRLMGRRLREAPVATGAKILGFAGLPLAAVTAYNMMDPERKKVYDNISPYEKENNFILILPGAEQGEDGSYEGVFKIPIQQGLSDIIQPIRRSMEAFQNQSPLDFAAIGGDIISSISGPIETKSLESFGGSLTPQVAKPIVQQALNKDLYTGKQIIPDYMNDSTDADGNPTPESKKAYENTSGSSRWIAEKLGVSPLRVDKFIKDTSSKVGQYSQNELDKVLASTGAIPKNQIGGVFIADDFIRRFGKASGVENFKKSEGAKYYDTIKEVTAGFNKNELAAYNSLHPSKKNFLGERILEDDSTYDPAARLDIYNRFSKVFEADKRMDLKNREKGEPGNPLFDLTPAQVKKVLEKDNLPPGAKDPELSNLYSQDWYAEYKNRKTAFFEQLKSKAKAENRQFGSSDNPYPNTPPELQKVMDYYNNLPSGTGARSQWIRSNPGLFDAMKGQWAAVDEWQNVARGKRGLAATEGEAGVANGFGTGSSTKYASSGGSGGSGGGSDGFNPYKYNVSMKTGKINKPTVKMLASGAKISAVKSGAPKVSIKKSKV